MAAPRLRLLPRNITDVTRVLSCVDGTVQNLPLSPDVGSVRPELATPIREFFSWPGKRNWYRPQPPQGRSWPAKPAPRHCYADASNAPTLHAQRRSRQCPRHVATASPTLTRAGELMTHDTGDESHAMLRQALEATRRHAAAAADAAKAAAAKATRRSRESAESRVGTARKTCRPSRARNAVTLRRSQRLPPITAMRSTI